MWEKKWWWEKCESQFNLKRKKKYDEDMNRDHHGILSVNGWMERKFPFEKKNKMFQSHKCDLILTKKKEGEEENKSKYKIEIVHCNLKNCKY